ncbi:MAG: phosphoribosyltransferase [Cyanobacteria bacterium J06659_2]
MGTRFYNRIEAGQLLANQLKAYASRTDVLVLGLPRGGVPVAYEVAHALNLPLDICLVRKLGVPDHRELAMGAIAFGGVRILNDDILSSLSISDQTLERVTARELRELQRRDRAYRGNRPQPEIRDQIVILVDDGIATGATMQAAIAVLKSQRPRQFIVATPVAPIDTYQTLKAEVDQMTCLATPTPFYAISLWYEYFDQTTDEEVRKLLAQQHHNISLIPTMPNAIG